MRFIFASGILILTCTSVLTQGNRNLVVWSADAGCGFKSRTIEGVPQCQSIATPRGNISAITLDDISLAVGFLDEDGFIIVTTQIKNRTNYPLDVDTDLWTAAHFKNGEEFYKGKKPFVAETSIPSRDIMRGITSGVIIDNSSDTFMASITKTSETREVRRPDGTRVKRVVITDDPEAVRVAGSRSNSRLDLANSEEERIRKNAFTQKWIPAQSSIKGLVYFRRVKKANFVIFSFKLLDVTYVFRLNRATS